MMRNATPKAAKKATHQTAKNEPAFWATVRRDHPDYVRWFIADAASAFGSALTSIPLTLVSYHITGSLSQAGIIGAASSAGSMIMTLPAGMIIDRTDKKKLLFFSGVLQLVLWSGFAALVYCGVFVFWSLLAFGLCAGIITGAFGGLTNAILRFIVAENLIVQAQGRNQTRDSAIWMAGLPLGGLLYGVAPVLPFIIQALTGLGPLYASRAIRTDVGSGQARRRLSVKQMWADATYSLAWIWRYPVLRTIFSVDIFSNFANFYLIAAIDLWLAHLGVAGWIIGLTSTMFTLGLICGGCVQDRLIRWFPAVRILRAAKAWELSWYVFLLVFSHHWQMIALGAFCIVLPAVACNSYTGSVFVLSAPPERIGACAAGGRLVMAALPVIASVSAGTLLATVGFPWSMLLCITCALLACAVSSRPLLRSLPKAKDFETLPVCE